VTPSKKVSYIAHHYRFPVLIDSSLFPPRYPSNHLLYPEPPIYALLHLFPFIDISHNAS